jgi:hypothetical protein
MSGSSCYDRNDTRENKGGGKTTYENEDKEGAFNPKDANGNPPKAAKTRNPRTKSVSTEGRKMTIHSSQTRDAKTQGQ